VVSKEFHNKKKKKSMKNVSGVETTSTSISNKGENHSKTQNWFKLISNCKTGPHKKPKKQHTIKTELTM
jgi:hypothetical protein